MDEDLGAARVQPTVLTVARRQSQHVESEVRLTQELEDIDSLSNGEAIVLARGLEDYIKEIRSKECWSASIRRGAIWTIKSFALGETEYRDFIVKRSRSARLLGRGLRAAMTIPPPEKSLTSDHVRSLFKAYLLETDFPMPLGMGGA